MRWKAFLTVLVAAAAVAMPSMLVDAPEAHAVVLPPGGSFDDDDGSPHEGDIEAIYAAGVTNGCGVRSYCPATAVTREQMAAFLDRALGLPAAATDSFTDDESSPFESSINRLAAADITQGCASTRFCPTDRVTRGEMASFLVRALGLAPGGVDHFSDDDGSGFEADINALAEAGITKGCGTGRYCPYGAVTRAEMASFIARGLGLDPIVPPPPAHTTLYVDVDHPSASDANPGTQTAPLRTIQMAVELASDIRKSGKAARIAIAPGVYREHVHVGHSTADAPDLVIEAEVPGTVRVTGTDSWTGWQSVAAGVYAHSWQFDWSAASGVAEIVGRREVAFHDGVRLNQVLSQAELKPGSFFVNESANQILVAVSTGVPSAIEVAVRPQVLKVDGAKNVTIRGIQFSGAATPFGASAVQITNVSNLTLDGAAVRDNSWVGVSVTTSQNVTLRATQVESNGGGGVNVYRVTGLQLLASETSRNNWRGVRGDYTGLTIAGIKIVGSPAVTIDGHSAFGNHTRGVWVDYDIAGFTIKNSQLCDNLTDGLFIEAAQGPSSVANTLLCRNGRYGLLIANGRNVTVSGTTMCQNAKSALRLESDGAGGRTIETSGGSILLAGADHLTLQNNVFAGSPRLFDSNLPSGQWSGFVTTLESDMNTFDSAAAVAFFYQSAAHSIGEWRLATGEDGGSTVNQTSC